MEQWNQTDQESQKYVHIALRYPSMFDTHKQNGYNQISSNKLVYKMSIKSIKFKYFSKFLFNF